MKSDFSDLEVSFRVSPTRRMVEVQAVSENGEFHFTIPPERERLRDARVKLVVTVGKGLHESLSREEQEKLRERLLEADPAELKVKIEHEPETATETTPLSVARAAEDKLRAYWALKVRRPLSSNSACYQGWLWWNQPFCRSSTADASTDPTTKPFPPALTTTLSSPKSRTNMTPTAFSLSIMGSAQNCGPPTALPASKLVILQPAS